MLPDKATIPPLSVLSLPNSSHPIALLLEKRVFQPKRTNEAERKRNRGRRKKERWRIAENVKQVRKISEMVTQSKISIKRKKGGISLL